MAEKSPLSSFICRTLFQTYLVMHGPKNGNEGEILIEIIIALLCRYPAPHLMSSRWPGLLPAGETHEIFNLLYTFFFCFFFYRIVWFCYKHFVWSVCDLLIAGFIVCVCKAIFIFVTLLCCRRP